MYIAGDALIVAVYKNRNNSERRMAEVYPQASGVEQRTRVFELGL